MKTFVYLSLLVAVLQRPVIAQGDPAASDTLRTVAATKIEVRITHRVFTSFADTSVVEIGEEFWAGDTEYSAVVTRFNPDFGIKEQGEVIARSQVPHNPAFQIRVLKDGEQVDEVWAFLGNGAPHYRRNSLLGFQVLSFMWQGERLESPIPREAE